MTKAGVSSYELDALPPASSSVPVIPARRLVENEADGQYPESSPPSSVVLFWQDMVERYPHLHDHAIQLISYVEAVDDKLRDATVPSIDFATVERWYRLHGSLEFLPFDRQPYFELMAQKMRVDSWEARHMRGNLLHEAGLMEPDHDRAKALLRRAQEDYAKLKDQQVCSSHVRKALAHWHDAQLEIARRDYFKEPSIRHEDKFAYRYYKYLCALVGRIEQDSDRVSAMSGMNTRKGHLGLLAGDAWEIFSVLAYNDWLIQNGLWTTGSARSAMLREDQPRLDLGDRYQKRSSSAKRLGVRRRSVDAVVSDLSAGVHVAAQMKTGGSQGHPYEQRIRKVLARYKNKGHLIDDILVSLDVMKMQYQYIEETSVTRTHILRHLTLLACENVLAEMGYCSVSGSGATSVSSNASSSV